MQKENTIRIAGASPENYLLAISEISAEKGGSARQIEIVDYLGFSKPSVSRGMKVLVKKGLVTIAGPDSPTKDIYLTDAGGTLANGLFEKRRVVAALLESLGIPEKDAKAEAHLWMHSLSDETAAAVKAFLSRTPAANGRGV